MTKKQAIALFRADVLPYVRKRYEQNRRIDESARREAWNNWIDMMLNDRLITRYQADHWTNPW